MAVKPDLKAIKIQDLETEYRRRKDEILALEEEREKAEFKSVVETTLKKNDFYRVSVFLPPVEVEVWASNKAEARKLAKENIEDGDSDIISDATFKNMKFSVSEAVKNPKQLLNPNRVPPGAWDANDFSNYFENFYGEDSKSRNILNRKLKLVKSK